MISYFEIVKISIIEMNVSLNVDNTHFEDAKKSARFLRRCFKASGAFREE